MADHQLCHDEPLLTENKSSAEAAPRTVSPPPAEQAQTASKKRSVVRGAVKLASGSCLPLCGDRVRNNVKSRVLLWLVYVLGAAVVALIAIFTFYNPPPNILRASFSVPPPNSVGLGAHWPPFSVSVRDAHHEPVEGIMLVLSVSPTQPIQMIVPFPDGSEKITRTITCLESIVDFGRNDTLDLHWADDLVLCLPHNSKVYGAAADFLTNRIVTTNAQGVGVFENVTLLHGVTGNYLLLVQAMIPNSKPIILRSFVAVSSVVISAEVDTSSVLVMEQGLGFIPLRVPTNITVDLVIESADKPVAIAAQFIPLNIEFGAIRDDNDLFAPFPALGAVDKAAFLFNNLATSENFTSVGPKLWETSLTFVNVTVHGTNSREMHFGIIAGGMTKIVEFYKIRDPGQFPSILFPPVVVITDVAFVEASIPSTNVIERDSLNITVRVTDRDGLPLIGRAVFARLEPAENHVIAKTGTDYQNAPSIGNEKRLLFNSGFTGADGKVTLASQISVTGAVGWYWLYVNSDGIEGNWSSSSADGLPNIDRCEIYISSRVHIADFSMSSAPWKENDTEVVGRQWEQVPSVRVVDELGEPIPGKLMEVRPRNASEVGIEASSLLGNDLGWIYLRHIKAVFAVREGTFVFDVLVDGIVGQSFEKALAWPVDADPTKCAYTGWVGELGRYYSGVLYTMTVVALSITGAPVKGAQVIQKLDPSIVPPPIGMEFAFVGPAETDENGIARLDVRSGGVCRWMVVPLVSACLDWDGENYSLYGETTTALPVLSRVKKITGIRNVNDWEFDIFVDADWSQVNSTNPLKAEAVGISTPASIALYYPPQVYPRAKGNASAFGTSGAIRFLGSSPAPGTFIFLFDIDGTVFRVPRGDIVTNFGTVYDVYAGASNVHPIGIVNLRIVRSCSSGRVEIGVPFEVQPQVAFDRLGIYETGNVSAIFFAQLGIEQNNSQSSTATATIDWIDYAANYSDISRGAIISFDPHEYRPVTVNCTTSIATFLSIGILGAIPGKTYRIRYCYTIKGPFENGTIADICTVEDARFVFNASQAMTISLSTYELPATPGNYLGEIIVTLKRADGLIPTKIMFFPGTNISALMASQGASFEGSANDLQSYTTGYGYPYVARGGTFIVNFRMLFGALTPGGAYPVVFSGPGCLSAPLIVSVSTAPSAISIEGVDDNYHVALQTVIGITVSVFAASGAKLPGKAVQISITHSICVFEGCGTFTDHSRTFARTDSNGEARFAIAFENANTSKFGLLAQLSPPQSSAATRQSVLDDLTMTAQTFGVPVKALKTMFADERGDLFDVLDSILSDSQSSIDSQLTLSMGELVKKLSDNLQSIDIVRQFLPIQTTLDAATPLFVVHNPVHRIEVVQEHTFTLTIARGELESLMGNPLPPFVLTADDAPVLRLLDSDGNPVANASIVIQIVPASEESSVEPPTNTSDKAGIISMEGAAIRITSPGNYKFFVSSNGGGFVALESEFTVEQKAAMSTSDAMQYAAFIVVAVFSPLLLASVPYSRRVYTICSTFFAVALASFAIYVAVDTVDSESIPNALVRIYIFIVILIAICVSLAALTMSIIEICGLNAARIGGWKIVNDEARALDTFLYARWITNARVSRQAAAPVQQEEKNILQKKMSALQDRAALFKEKSMERVNKTLDVELIDLSKGRTLREDDSVRPLVQPRDVKEPSVLPVSFIVVLSVATVLLIALTLFCINLYYVLALKVGELVAYLPNPDDPNVVEKANSLFVSGVTYAIVLIVKVFPQFSFLAALTGPIQDVNLIATLNEFRGFVESVIGKVLLGFIAAVTVADIVVIVSCVLMAKRIPELIKKARRGELSDDGDLTSTEGYIGLHAIHFVLLHQIVFWPTLLFVLLLGVAPVRSFLFDQLKVIVVASLTSMVIQFAMERIFLGWFLTQGYFAVRPEFYSMWHFVDLVLGVFSGFVESVTRWVRGIALFTGLFARLDRNIYPEGFEDSDGAHGGFVSMVIAEAKNSNPIFLCFSSLLILEQQFRRIADSGEGGRLDVETLDRVQQEDVSTSAIVKNITRIYVRSLAALEGGQCCPLELWKLPPANATVSVAQYTFDSRRAKLERIRQRWWLLVMLHMNPSLRAKRKHQLYEDDDDAAAARDGDDPQEESQA